MAAHSPIGASGAHRWFECPGSVRLAKSAPPPPSSAYAEEGTFAHAVAEFCLHNRCAPPAEFQGQPVPEEMREAVTEYCEVVMSAVHESGTVDSGFEQRFHLKQIHPDAFGTADAWTYNGEQRLLRVFDFKYGAGVPVEAKGNPQLRYYALGVLLEKPDLLVDTVRVVIVQPRCYHPDGPVRSEDIDALELLDFEADLRRYIAATEDPNAPLVPGEHCRFCPAARICPKLEEKAQALARMEFAPVASAPEALPAYEPQKLAEALALADILEARIKQVREFAYAEAMHGRTPPGWKLVNKQARRKWRDEAEAAEALGLYGLPDDSIYERSLRSPAQIEKALGKANAELLNSLVVKESSGYTLVPESDKRPAVKLDAKSEFTPVAIGQ